jgi:hypothetical protein
LTVASSSEDKLVRIMGAITGVLSAIPLAIALAVLLLDSLAHPSRRGFGIDLAFISGLLVAGPVAVLVTSVLLATRVRYAGAFHLAALAIAGVLGVLAAGFIAIGGGGTAFVLFLFAAPIGFISVLLTIVALVRGSGQPAPKT